MKFGLFAVLRAFLGIFLVTAITMFAVSVSFGGDKISVPPTVFEYGGDDYCVIWETSKKGSGYVKYSFEGEEIVRYDEAGGVIRTDETIHRVFVPKEELRENEYVVGSQYVGFKKAYDAIKGETVESEAIRFGGAEKEDDIKILSVSDIHGAEFFLYRAVSRLDYTPDLIVILGDAASGMETKAHFSAKVLENAARLSGGSAPVAYVRGNHEARGEFASRLAEYLPVSGDGLYYSFEFGPLSAVVLDTGEDKEDGHREYSGLVDFETYRAREQEWIDSLSAGDFGGRYKLVFAHIPGISGLAGRDWATPFREMGFDLQVSAHLHKAEFTDGELPVLIDGGTQTAGFLVSTIELKDGNIDMTVTDAWGKTVLSETVPAG